MPAQEKRMAGRVFREHLPDTPGEARHVLVVLEDRNPLPMLMRGDAFEALQHLVARDGEPTRGRVPFRQHGAPDRVRVQHGTGAARTGDLDVQQAPPPTAGRATPSTAPSASISDDRVGRQAALRDAAAASSRAGEGHGRPRR